MACDKELIAGIQPLQKAQGGHMVGLSRHSAIAAPACEDEVPYSVDADAESYRFQCMLKEMVDVRRFWSSEREGLEAVKAVAHLIAA